jgi:hypothetical protein
MDSSSISMVIQNQLPIIIRKYASNSCLFNADLLGYSVADISEQVIRDSLNGNSVDLEMWDRFFKHFISLKRMGFLDSTSIARLFAPSLVVNSNSVEKAKKILERVINLSTIHLNDPLAESQSFTETSINKSLQLASSSKLRETSAYQQFILGSTQNSNKSKINEQNQESDDDDNDEIDALVAPKSILSNNTVTSVRLSNNLNENAMPTAKAKSSKISKFETNNQFLFWNFDLFILIY